jgi:hypothetical protein
MKTAMEELIEYIEEWTAKNKTTDGIWSKAKSLLSKEKQQIIDAWENGYQHGACVNEDKDKFHGVQYYNETFNNETTNND